MKKNKTKKKNNKKLTRKPDYKQVIQEFLNKHGLTSGVILCIFIMFIIFLGMTVQESEFLKLKEKIKKLQHEKIKYENIQKKLVRQKTELEDSKRIKTIAQNQLGLIENQDKDILIIKLK